MKKIIFLFALAFSCTPDTVLDGTVSAETAKKEIKGTLENNPDQQNKPYVILVSLDGFRYDYAKRFGAKNLLSFDVQAEKMIPSFPSKTFPNHYSIATGLYPGHNGLVSNEFYDRELGLTYDIMNRETVENPAFYSGTPLWVLAAQQEMVSSSMFWVGSEVAIKDEFPTNYFKYDGSISNGDRVNQTISWLQLPAAKRPHLITLYFSMIDDIGHRYGPDSKEIEQGVKDIDSLIGNLISKVNQLDLPVNVIIVSDHGMLEIDYQNLIDTEDIFPAGVNVTTSFPAMIYSDNVEKMDSLYSQLIKDTSKFNVYKKNNLPSWFHYNMLDERIGDLVLMPKPPYAFSSKDYTIKKGNSTHGYDPKITPGMGAIFYAKGPAFKKGLTIAPFENVHVYPLITTILNLDYDQSQIDGQKEKLLPILSH